MSYTPNNPNGQASPANSAPVVLDTTDASNLATLATNSGTAASAANQATEIASLSAIQTSEAASATAANQTTELASLAAIQANAAASATAANQATANAALSAIQSSTAASATAANQATANSTLSSIAASEALSATAANQTTELADLASLVAATTTESTAALQTAGNTSLTAIANSVANIPAKGSATSANSTPVTIASDQAAVPMTASDLYVSGQSAQTAVVNNILTVASGTSATDTIGFKSASVQVVSTATSGAFIFEGSNDNVNFQTVPVYNQLILTGTPITAAITATASQLIYILPLNFRYLRLRISTVLGGGSVQAFSKFSQSVFSPAVSQMVQNTATNLQTTSTISSGTVSTVTTLANGQTAHSSPSTGSPLRVAGRVNTTLDTTLVQGDASDLFMSTAGQLVEKPYSTSENDWVATSGTTALATTTSTALKAAGAASIRNYCTALQLFNTSATVSTTVTILDGSTVIWTGFLPATTSALPLVPLEITFPTPLKGTAATAMNIQLGTASASVYYNVQGYQSF